MKKITLKNIFVCALLTFLLWPSAARAGEASLLYSQAQSLAKCGEYEFAYLRYTRILREFPQMKVSKPALFGVAEYEFSIANYRQAKPNFETWIKRNPKAPERLFALAYLWKIASDQNDTERQQILRDEIIALKQVSLVFRDSKTYRFRSPLRREHEAVFQIDKIQFYSAGDIFAEIVY